MKVLFLPAYFYPERVASSYLGINRNEAFAKAGFDSVFYVPVPSRGVTKETRREYKRKRNEVFYDGRMIVHRFYLFREGKNPVIRAFRYTIGCIIQFCKACFEKNVDLIFLSSTPPIQGLQGVLIKKIKRIPFVYNLQDIFPDSLVGTGLTTKGSLLWRIGRIIENITYKNADKIIVLSNDFKNNLLEKGVPEEKIEVIYNWVDQSSVVNIVREHNILFDKYNLDRNKFYISYCGNIGLTQNMDLLLDVAADLMEITDIHFVLLGEGAYKKEMEKIIMNRKLSNVTLLPFQPYEDISHVFSLGDVGLIISKPGVGKNSLPSKTWSIMSAERPVLANFDENELKDIIENNKCGYFTKAGDKNALKKAIIELYQNKHVCVEYGKNGRAFVMKNLTKEVGTSKLVQVLKDCCK